MQIKHEAANKATEIKNAAIAFGIYGNDARRLGDLALTNKGLVWSNGKAKNAKDVTVKWDALITWMSSQLPAGAKAKKPAKSRASAGTNGNAIATPARKAAKKPVRAPKASRKNAH